MTAQGDYERFIAAKLSRAPSLGIATAEQAACNLALAKDGGKQVRLALG